jgi:type II secretory pathway pseudopilin PulG
MRKVIDKRAQVWVETVIYTLIGLAIIGLVMAVALPKINQKKDEIIIDQSIEALGNIDDKIYEVQRAVGNRRVVNLEIRKGSLVIDMDADTISWVIDSSFAYSEEGLSVPLGRLNVTTRTGNPWEVELKIGYSMDIQHEGETGGTKRLDPAPTPYRLVIENSGKNSEENIIIDLSDS